MKKETIYVKLIDEIIPMFRPVEAIKLEDSIYKISNQEYNTEAEEWEFAPGDKVITEEKIDSSNGKYLLAISIYDR